MAGVDLTVGTKMAMCSEPMDGQCTEAEASLKESMEGDGVTIGEVKCESF